MQKSLQLYERFSPMRWGNLIWFGLLLVVATSGQIQAQTKRYVKAGGSGNQSGLEWSHASGDLQAMINASSSGEEVWVAAGEYQRSSGQYFTLKEGVRIYGGFPDSGTPTVTDRNWITHVTTLRGNNESVIVNLSGSNLTSLAVLDGFSITGGYSSQGGGGGIALVACSPTLSNLKIYGNSAYSGGGVFIGGSSPILTNILVYKNSAINNSAGGGLVSAHAASPVLKNVTITGNTATWGGAIFNYPGSNTQLQNCIIHGNTASSDPTITNSGDGKITASHSLIEGSGGSGAWNNDYGTNNGNNIDVNPLFVDVANNDFSLQACSPAINAGDNTASTTEKDLAGNSRIFNNTIDLGAFEFQGQASLKTAITTEPALSSAVCAGGPVAISVVATGTGTLHYQWKRGNTPVGTNSSILSFSAQDADAGTYSVTISGDCGTATSREFTLTVNPNPQITLSNNGPITCSVPSVTLTASALEGASYVFSSGATQVGNTNTATVSQADTYSVVVTAPSGCTASASAEVASDQTPPAAPILTLAAGTTQPILQNTPSVSLVISACEGGTLHWIGPNNTNGNATTIAIPTGATGTLVYSATCTIGTCSSLPGTLNVVIAAPAVSGSFDGFINGADCGSFRGWAWERNKPNNAVSVEILDGSTVIATLLADQFRQDLLDAGKGNGKHAFRFTIPASLKDGLPHNLAARVSGSGFILKDSPKALICEGSSTPGGNKLPQPPTPTVLISPVVAQVGVPFSGTLVAFTDPEGGNLTYALSGLPTGLTLGTENRVISGTPTETGIFVLTYSATDDQGATNSVSFNLTINPAATTGVTGSFEGFLDKLDCGGIRGWVWDRKLPNTPLTVEFYTETSPGQVTVWGSTLANFYRADLKDAGKGNGAHAYNFTAPAGLASGTLVQARVLGSSFVLKGSPKAYQCASARMASPDVSVKLQVTVLGNPVAGDAVEVDVQGSAGQPLRLLLTNQQGQVVEERHGSGEHHRLSVAGQPAGLLLLRVSTPTQSQTVKLIKAQ